MPPHQPNSPSPRPQPSQPHVTPHAPHIGYGAPGAEHFQTHPDGLQAAAVPTQEVPADTPISSNPFEFIINQEKASKHGAAAGDGLFKTIALVVGGVVLLLAVAALAINALTPKGSTPGMIGIAERQEEIVRIAADASQQATSTDVKNFAVNVSLGVSSSQRQMIDFLTAHSRTKLNDKALQADKSAQTDNELAAATTANNYDSAVTDTLVSQLQTYEKLLQNTYKQTNNKKTQQLLQTTYNSTDLLLRQGQATAKDFGG